MYNAKVFLKQTPIPITDNSLKNDNERNLYLKVKW